jgi:hypothetical protein
MNNTGNTITGPINLVNVGSINVFNTGDLTLSSTSLSGGGLIQLGTGNLALNSGTPNPTGQNLTLLVDPAGRVLLGGTATSWNFNSTTNVPLSNFFTVTPGTGVAVGGTIVVAGSADLFQQSVVSSAQASASAAATEEAGKTFGTDSVAEQVEYGFAGDVGVLPPMDHRLQGVGISVPKCFNESREGEGC